MSGLAHAISLLTDTFEKHAGKDEDCKTLSKSELAELLRSEFPEKGNSRAVVESFFTTLDNDSNGAVDFKEFVTFVTALAVMMKR
ncbi:protein S100-B [Hippoglossus stenolepis]|uniref:protein S100-B n=1 Tax=Hippoglossus stenolepis TaxID=195615 RepID=UPI001FAFAF20|nr:protein S100-B [Hippoglossus stenolepis]